MILSAALLVAQTGLAAAATSEAAGKRLENAVRRELVTLAWMAGPSP
jgi:hypothetical protein